MDNKQIALNFRKIKKLLKEQGEDNGFRLRAYDRAAEQIEMMDRELSEVVAEGKEAFFNYCANYQSVGTKSRAKILELIETGTCSELQALKSSMPVVQEEMFSEEEMAPVKKRKSSVNHRPEVTAVRRPREQAVEVVDRVLPVCQKYFNQVEVVGSWRRGRADIKDIDIALSSPKQDRPVSELFTLIENELKIQPENIIKKGEAQTAFYAESAAGQWHVDIWYMPSDSWGAALMFSTGPMEFNVEMRGWLKARGMKLNRYGLYKVVPGGSDEVIASRTEADIFHALDMEYVPPEERVHFEPRRYPRREAKDNEVSNLS